MSTQGSLGLLPLVDTLGLLHVGTAKTHATGECVPTMVTVQASDRRPRNWSFGRRTEESPRTTFSSALRASKTVSGSWNGGVRWAGFLCGHMQGSVGPEEGLDVGGRHREVVLLTSSSGRE